MKNLKSYLLCMVALALVACTAPKSPAQAVFQLKGDYAAALSIETAYDKLPTCGTDFSGYVCKDLKLAKTVRQIDDSAYAALGAAESAVRTPGFGEERVTTAVATATNAIAAFVSITSTLGVK